MHTRSCGTQYGLVHNPSLCKLMEGSCTVFYCRRRECSRSDLLFSYLWVVAPYVGLVLENCDFCQYYVIEIAGQCHWSPVTGHPLLCHVALFPLTVFPWSQPRALRLSRSCSTFCANVCSRPDGPSQWPMAVSPLPGARLAA